MVVKTLANDFGKGNIKVTFDTAKEPGRLLQLWKEGYRVQVALPVPPEPPAVTPEEGTAVAVTDLTVPEEPKPKRKKGK